MFYLEDTLVVHQGDCIQGTLSCAPNPKNPRDLDIEVQYSMEGRKGAWEGTQQYKLR